MSSTATYSKSQAKLLAEAKKLFWKHGISRVSVEEICTNAGVSKMTFYRSFDNKYVLAKIIIQEITNKNLLRFREIIGQSIPFDQKMEEFLRMKIESSKSISMELVADMYQPKEENQELVKYFTKAGEAFKKELRSMFETAQKNHEIRSDINIELIMYMMEVMQKEMQNPHLLSLYDDVTKMTSDLTSHFFYGFIKQQDEK